MMNFGIVLLVFIAFVAALLFGAFVLTTLLVKGTLLVFGVSLSFWGIFLLVLALQIIIAMFRGSK